MFFPCTWPAPRKYSDLAKKTKASYCLTSENFKSFLPNNCKAIITDKVLLHTAQITKIFYPDSITDDYDNTVKEIGETKLKDRKDQYDEISDSDNKVLIATYGVASVGINIPRIFNLILIEPGKSFIRVIQSIGRGIRKAKDKDFVQIWDITSTCKFAKRHLTQRKKFYKEANYPFTIEKLDWS